MSDRLTDVANIIGRSRHNPGVTDRQLAQQVLDTVALPRPRPAPKPPTTTTRKDTQNG